MKHDNLYLQVFINALVTQILSPASPSMRFLHRAAVKQCRTHSEPIHNEAHRPHESTRQRAWRISRCSALQWLCKFLSALGFPKIPRCILHTNFVSLDAPSLVRSDKSKTVTMAGPRLLCFTHPCDTDSL